MVAYRSRTTEPVQQDPAIALVISPRRVIAKPFRLPFRTPFPQGGALGCYRVAPSARKTLNLTCRLSSAFGPLRSNPIFVFFMPFGVEKSRFQLDSQHTIFLVSNPARPNPSASLRLCVSALAFGLSRTQPPARAPTMRNGSSPIATARGRGASGGA